MAIPLVTSALEASIYVLRCRSYRWNVAVSSWVPLSVWYAVITWLPNTNMFILDEADEMLKALDWRSRSQLQCLLRYTRWPKSSWGIPFRFLSKGKVYPGGCLPILHQHRIREVEAGHTLWLKWNSDHHSGRHLHQHLNEGWLLTKKIHAQDFTVSAMHGDKDQEWDVIMRNFY